MLKKVWMVDQVEVTRDNHIQVRCANLIIEDGTPGTGELRRKKNAT